MCRDTSPRFFSGTALPFECPAQQHLHGMPGIDRAKRFRKPEGRSVDLFRTLFFVSGDRPSDHYAPRTIHMSVDFPARASSSPGNPRSRDPALARRVQELLAPLRRLDVSWGLNHGTGRSPPSYRNADVPGFSSASTIPGLPPSIFELGKAVSPCGVRAC